MGEVVELRGRFPSRLPRVRKLKQPDDDLSLLRRKATPEIQQGEFVSIFSELKAIWACWAGYSLAEIVERHPEEIRDGNHGLATGHVEAALDAGEG